MRHKTNSRLLEMSKLSKVDYEAVEVVEVAEEVERSSPIPETMPLNQSKAS
jgi:hypothetical protein